MSATSKTRNFGLEFVIGLLVAIPLAVLSNRMVEALAWGMLPPILPFVLGAGPALVAIVGLFRMSGGMVAGAVLVLIGNFVHFGLEMQAIEERYAANVKAVDALNQLPSAPPRQPHAFVIVQHPESDWLFGGSQQCIAGCMQMLLASPYAVAFEIEGNPTFWQVYRNPPSPADCDAPGLAASRLEFIQQHYAHRCAIGSREPAGDEGLVVDFKPSVNIPAGANASAQELRERIGGHETLLGREASDVNTPKDQVHTLAELLPPSMHFPDDYRPARGPDTSQALLAALMPLMERAETQERAFAVFDYLLGEKDADPEPFGAAAFRFIQSSDPALAVLGLRSLRALSPEDRTRAWPLVVAALDADDPIVVVAALNLFNFYDDAALDEAWPAVTRLATTRLIAAGAARRDDVIAEPLLAAIRRHRGAFEPTARQAALTRLASIPAPSVPEALVSYGLAAHGNAEAEAEAHAALVRLPRDSLFETVLTLGFFWGQWGHLVTNRAPDDFWQPSDLAVLAERSAEMSDEQIERYVASLCRQRGFKTVRNQFAAVVQTRLASLRQDPDGNRMQISALEELSGSKCRI